MNPTATILSRRAIRRASILLIVTACSDPSEPPPVTPVPGLTGTLVVANKMASTVSILDVASGERLATIPVGAEPHELALSADGTTAVTTAMGGSTLSVIDVPTRRVARTIGLGPHSSTHGISFLPGDTIAAITSAATRTIVLVDVQSGTVVASIPAGARPHILQVAARSSRVYTSEPNRNTITEFDPVARKLLRTFAVPKEPEGMTVTPDGAEVWVGSSTFFMGKVSVLDPRSGAVSTVLRMRGWPYRLHLTTDTRTVLVPDLRRSRLYVIDRASRREIGRVQLDGGELGGLAITPDGRYAFQTVMDQSRVAIVDVAGRRVVGNLHVGDSPDGVAYTPSFRDVGRDRDNSLPGREAAATYTSPSPGTTVRARGS